MADRAGSEELLQRLIDMGADVNAPATGGVTPLHVAAEVGLKDVVQILLKVGSRQTWTLVIEVSLKYLPGVCKCACC